MNICAIVLDYRGAQKTAACIRSLAGQGLTSVIVVDNSADAVASAELAELLQVREPNHADFTLHLQRAATNLGFAGGVNFALNSKPAQECDAILLINNDAVLSLGALKYLAEALAEGPYDVISPMVTDDFGKHQPTAHYQRYFGLMTTHALPGSFPFPSGSCMLLRRNLIGAGKLFDEDFFMYGEDTMLGWRLARDNKEFTVVDQALVRHTGQGRESMNSLFYEYHMARAHLLLAQKTLRTPLELPLMVMTKCLGLIVRAILRCWRYRNGMPLQAFFLAWSKRAIRKN